MALDLAQNPTLPTVDAAATERSMRLAGLGWGLASAAAFATSGSLARPLLAGGWSPGAVVLMRVSIAAFTLLPFALRSLRKDRAQRIALRRAAPMLALFGTVGVALLQFAYFSSIAHMSVGPAILIEHAGIPLVVLWMWARHQQRPNRVTLAGGAVAAVGLALVLGIFAGGTLVTGAGVAWASLAAVACAVYFVLSARTGDGLEPVVTTTAALLIGAATLGLAALVGVLPVTVGAGTVHLSGLDLPWWAPALWLGVIAAALAYSTGVRAGRLLGPTLASFLGMAEVVLAIGFAAVLLGEIPSVAQAVGAAVVLGGLAAVEWGMRRPAAQDQSKVVSTVAEIGS